MRGSPLLRAALTFLILLGLAPVLWQMTRSTPRPEQAVAATPSGPVKIQLEIAFTTAPRRVTLSHLGQTVWQKDAPETREECELELAWPQEGGELLCKVEWPEGAPLSAMRVRLTEPGGGEIERSLWGSGPVEKVLGFP